MQLRKGRETEAFVVAGKGVDGLAVPEALPPLVEGLLVSLPLLLPGFLVEASHALVPVQAHGALVPDVVVTHPDGRRCFIEVLGFWSRDAVWHRIDLARQGLLPAPMVFCFSERLRVSEEALGPTDVDASSVTLAAALIAFKGSLSARTVAQRLLALLA